MTKTQFNKVWKDPVGSKLIAASILAIISSIYVGIKSYLESENFITVFLDFWTKKIPLWGVLSVLAISLIVYWIFKKSKSENEKNEIDWTYNENTLNLDKKTFNKIKNELLPSNKAIEYIRHRNFAGFSFDDKMLMGLYDIEHENTHPEFEFLNPILENLKEELILEISKFTSLVGIETFPTHQGKQTVPPEWEIEQPDRFDKVVNELHQSTNRICNKYDELIRKGRRVLNVYEN